MISSAWCGGICIDRVSQHRFLPVFGISWRVVSLFLFFLLSPTSLRLPLLPACVRRVFVSLRKRLSSRALSSLTGAPAARRRGTGAYLAAFGETHGLFSIRRGLVSFALRLGPMVHEHVMRAIEMGILCILYGVGLRCCVHKNFPLHWGPRGIPSNGFLFHLSDPWRMGSCFAGAFCFLLFVVIIVSCQ
ncbi:hypothetical protein P170DRAFT_19691 [Aspergillus steynii IBT 23096]|uniref:Uncharacterized protein n=1 Tax=Aspergillus steynii IBT 23096 TaxID=1392250 RepID=A0A2I2GNN2_9EURO|nr:uncharacterized protein P170DRAFT_19691 [Aspergillus steynii IBT 23096]PLB54487.1 hypothetical protein P170DRAFT_19691 [Aspergillus steynii IBT 23096]